MELQIDFASLKDLGEKVQKDASDYLEQITLDFKEVLAYNISVERHDERIRYNRKGLVGS